MSSKDDLWYGGPMVLWSFRDSLEFPGPKVSGVSMNFHDFPSCSWDFRVPDFVRGFPRISSNFLDFLGFPEYRGPTVPCITLGLRGRHVSDFSHNQLRQERLLLWLREGVSLSTSAKHTHPESASVG